MQTLKAALRLQIAIHSGLGETQVSRVTNVNVVHAADAGVNAPARSNSFHFMSTAKRMTLQATTTDFYCTFTIVAEAALTYVNSLSANLAQLNTAMAMQVSGFTVDTTRGVINVQEVQIATTPGPVPETSSSSATPWYEDAVILGVVAGTVGLAVLCCCTWSRCWTPLFLLFRNRVGPGEAIRYEKQATESDSEAQMSRSVTDLSFKKFMPVPTVPYAGAMRIP